MSRRIGPNAEDFEITYDRASGLAKSGHWRKALHLLKATIEDEDTNTSFLRKALSALAFLCRENGRFEVALRFTTDRQSLGFASRADEIEHDLFVADLLMRLGRMASAERQFRRLLVENTIRDPHLKLQVLALLAKSSISLDDFPDVTETKVTSLFRRLGLPESTSNRDIRQKLIEGERLYLESNRKYSRLLATLSAVSRKDERITLLSRYIDSEQVGYFRELAAALRNKVEAHGGSATN